MDCNQHSIELPPKGMRDLLFLCAHDFKHDFVEDKERSSRALGDAGYHTDFPGGGEKSGAKSKGGSATVTVAPEETIEVVKKRVREHETSGRSRSRARKDVVSSQSTPLPSMLSQDAYTSPSLTLEQRREQQRAAAETRAAAAEAPERIENPESFPLICYVYLIVQSYGDPDFTFDKVCDYLELLSNKVLSGGDKRPRSDNVTDDSEQPAQARRRGPSRAARAPAGANTELSTPRPVSEPLGEKWDSYLELYKEWLEVSDINQYNYLMYRTFDDSAGWKAPRSNEKITWLIPHSEWREWRHDEAYISWEKMVHSNPGNMKKVINEIIKEHNDEATAQHEVRQRPDRAAPPSARWAAMMERRTIPRLTPYPDIEITRKNWNQFKKFSEVLLTKWKDFIKKPQFNPKAADPIFKQYSIDDIQYVDNKMWINFKSYFKTNHNSNLLYNERPSHGEPFSQVSYDYLSRNRMGEFWNNGDEYMIINNFATLTKYDGYKSQGLGWRCPIPSIIDPQPVCGKIPPAGHERIGDEEDGWPANF